MLKCLEIPSLNGHLNFWYIATDEIYYMNVNFKHKVQKSTAFKKESDY